MNRPITNTYFIHCSTKHNQKLFSCLAICSHMQELLRKYALSKAYGLTMQNHRIMVQKHKQLRILAYCLNPTSYTMLIHQERGSVQTLIQRINASLSWYYTNMFKDLRTLFQKPILTSVRNEYELISATRHIHLLPVHASTVCDMDSIETYPWSSLKEYVMGQEDAICDTTHVMRLFRSYEKYQQFIQTGQV